MLVATGLWFLPLKAAGAVDCRVLQVLPTGELLELQGCPMHLGAGLLDSVAGGQH